MNKRDSGVTGKLARQLLQEVLTGQRRLGERLNVKIISEEYKVSRTPVNAALVELERMKIVYREPNKGFFVCEVLPEDVNEWSESPILSEADPYHCLANDWLRDSIPETVTEQLIRERYSITKSKAIDIMNRAMREGWAERNAGYGWHLLAVAKTTEAFSELYRFRMAIEPAALLEPTFTLNRQVINEQRSIQNRILSAPEGTFTDEQILGFGALFHEELIKLSGNPYFLMALQRVNKMRKLMEYKAKVNRDRIVANCTEHLEILDLLEEGKIVEASYALRQHLSATLNRKASHTQVWDQEK
ncbi:GntR family transcriptional regulator [Nitrincola nitratireducens]|uniref:Transcriptional regulator n=1 Tax=Nitrincola nitratireducens TaxID=1229521 RepID=W9UZU6_9GAMM|nr:GntR family transcriptional regulator [Nitrincola nitratireducens]EXJ12604.1 Transcriptional regulator [Nitrincola nitratireducens]